MYFETHTITVDQKSKTAIPLGPESIIISRSMFQGGKALGYIASPSSVTPWFWQGIQTLEGRRCVYTDTENLQPLTLLFDSSSSLASRLDLLVLLIRSLNRAQTEIPAPWFAESFILPAVRIIPGTGALILPKPITELMEQSFTEQDKIEMHDAWIRPRLPAGTGWIFQCISLLYRMLTGIPPFLDDDVREVGYQPVPVGLLNPGVGSHAAKTINLWLKGAKDLPSAEDLASWIEANYEALTTESVRQQDRDAETALKAYRRDLARKAKRHVYLRKKGMFLAVISAAVVISAAFLISHIIEAAKPPPTVGWSAEEVVRYYYQLQDELKLDAMNDILSRSARKVRETQLVYLHVTSSVRRAYGGDELIRASDWIEAGKPQLGPTDMVYGITDLDIQRMDDLRYRASYIFWLPEGQETDPPSAQQVRVTGAYYLEELVLEKRTDHYIIDDIMIIESRIVY